MATPDLGQDKSKISERRRAQNRLAQRRHRQKKDFERQPPFEEAPLIDAAVLQNIFPADAGLAPSDGSSGLVTVDPFPPLPASSIASLGLSAQWMTRGSMLAASCKRPIPSKNPLSPADTETSTSPSIHSLDNPETARLIALTFTRSVSPRPNQNFSNNRNEPLIHTAARGNDVATLQLLRQAGFHLNERDHEGRTALHVTYEEHGVDAMVWLLEQGIDVHAVDNRGRTTLSMAVNSKCPVAVNLMLSHGANRIPEQPEQAWAWDMSNMY